MNHSSIKIVPTGNDAFDNVTKTADLPNTVTPFIQPQPVMPRNKVLLRKRKRSKHPLRELRIRAGFTLEELAESIKMSPSYLSRLESGSRRLNADIIERLAHALSCNPAELLPYSTYGTPATFGAPTTSSAASNANNPVDLPVYALTGSLNGSGTLETKTAEQWIARPVEFIGMVNAFACIIKNSQWVPRYMDGDRLFIHPSAPLRPLCSVLVIQKNGEVFVGRLQEMSQTVTGNNIVIENSYATEETQRLKTITIPQSDIAASYRIVGTLEAA